MPATSRGTIVAPVRTASVTCASARASSTEISPAELPAPTTSTRWPGEALGPVVLHAVEHATAELVAVGNRRLVRVGDDAGGDDHGAGVDDRRPRSCGRSTRRCRDERWRRPSACRSAHETCRRSGGGNRASRSASGNGAWTPETEARAAPRDRFAVCRTRLSYRCAQV